MTTPDDWSAPQWSLDSKIPHHWHNYTSSKLRDAWDTFNDEQKKVIAACLMDVAQEEDWD